MIIAYIVSAVVAGVMIALSLMGIGHDADHELHVEGVSNDGHGLFDGAWLPFFSLRFYTYFFAAFGATGLLLSNFSDTSSTATAWISGGVGLLSGLSVSILMRLLRVTETSGSASDRDVLGKEGQVLVPIRGNSPGRIRCLVRGDLIDFLAVSEEDRTIEAGESVVVVSMDNGRAQVMLRDTILGDLKPEKVS